MRDYYFLKPDSIINKGTTLEQPKSVVIGSQGGASYKNITLFVSALVLFSISFVTSGINVALPEIGREFQADAILLSWVVTAALLTIGVFLMPFGRISDIVGIKKIFLWGVVLFALASVAAAFSSSIIMLIVFSSLEGVGCAMIFGNSMAMLTAAFPANERGRAMGINAACVYIGMSLGPYLGGMLIEHFGWRDLFFVAIPACVAAVALVWWKIKGDWSAAGGEGFDIGGSLIVGAALIALMYGFSILPEKTGIAVTAAGIIGLVGFIIWETRAKSPMLDVRIFRKNKFFIFSNMANLISYAATSGVIFLLSLYLQYIKALTPDQAGLVLLAQPAMLVLFSPLCGVLSDRVEPRIVATAGMILTFLGLLIFCFLSEGTSLFLIVVVLMLTGLGFALFVTPNNNAIMGSVERKHFAVASSVTATLRQVGQTSSMAITMIILTMVIGRVAVTPEYYPGFITSARAAFAVFTVLAFACIFISLFRGKTKSA
jgi:EmrB/QacA subfamily drug resistance transporter